VLDQTNNLNGPQFFIQPLDCTQIFTREFLEVVFSLVATASLPELLIIKYQKSR
jgi:hypothetical protein